MDKDQLMKMDLQFFAENDDENQNEDNKQSTESKDEKTLTEEEVNRLIAQAKSKAKEEAKKELESEFLEKSERMVQQKLEDEKAKQELDSEQLEEYYKKQLQEKENEFNNIIAEYQKKETKRELTDLSIRILGDKSLPVNDKVLSFVVKDNEANTRQAIDDLADIILDDKNRRAVHEPNIGGGSSINSKVDKNAFDEARII